MLRHLVATLAYRASKVLRDPPARFATMSVGPIGTTPGADRGPHGRPDVMGRHARTRRVRVESRRRRGLGRRGRAVLRQAGKRSIESSRPGAAARRGGEAHTGSSGGCVDPRRTARDAARDLGFARATGKLRARGDCGGPRGHDAGRARHGSSTATPARASRCFRMRGCMALSRHGAPSGSTHRRSPRTAVDDPAATGR